MGAGGGLSSLSTSTISSARRCDRWSKALEVLLSTAKGQAWRLTGSAGVLQQQRFDSITLRADASQALPQRPFLLS